MRTEYTKAHANTWKEFCNLELQVRSQDAEPMLPHLLATVAATAPLQALRIEHFASMQLTNSCLYIIASRSATLQQLALLDCKFAGDSALTFLISQLLHLKVCYLAASRAVSCHLHANLCRAALSGVTIAGCPLFEFRLCAVTSCSLHLGSGHQSLQLQRRKRADSGVQIFWRSCEGRQRDIPGGDGHAEGCRPELQQPAVSGAL